jgi:glutamyl-tRNA reductase
MLDIVLLGLNHKTAPVELRECLAFSKEETFAALKSFQESAVVGEAVIISTCNRVEVLIATEDKTNAVSTVKGFLSEFKHLPVSEFNQSLYIHEGEDAVRHIFRVAVTLDSMVVGEPQILGQIKEAYQMATVKKTSGVVLNKLFHRTFFVAKRVRSETGIGDHAVSISYAAIELGRKIFGTFEDKMVLLIGAGEMAELAVEHLIQNRVGDIWVANRTFENGVELAKRFKGQAIRFEEIPEALKKVDIIISSTGSPDYVISRDHVKQIIRRRRNRPLFFIDIAVPRDIDPEINRLTNTYVYDIDDLKSVIDENIDDRNREAIKGERIVDEAVISFRNWYESLEVIPTIVALRDKISRIADAETKKTLQNLKHLSDDDREAIARMMDAMTNKILHHPTVLLKSNDWHQNKSLYLDITRKLFELDE